MADAILSTGQVISIADGRLACDVGEVYEALNTLLDEDFMTHQLIRAADYVKPIILGHCPWVASLPPLEKGSTKDEVIQWVEEISRLHGPSHKIPDCSVGWRHKHPIAELMEMMDK